MFNHEIINYTICWFGCMYIASLFIESIVPWRSASKGRSAGAAHCGTPRRLAPLPLQRNNENEGQQRKIS